MTEKQSNYIISDDKNLIDPDIVQKLIKTSYWAPNRDLLTIKKTIKNSTCFGIYIDGLQVGFARAVTDNATMYWLADVLIDQDHRSKGLGKKLVNFVTNHPSLKDLKGILATGDAHGLYEQYGFVTENNKYMTRKV